jgi:hypothetical protein
MEVLLTLTLMQLSFNGRTPDSLADQAGFRSEAAATHFHDVFRECALRPDM